ncbi:MAG TPA: hypothetical protein VMH79_17030 [Thermoanaerobaculia bacterium]|nr:hypothetical protein [Thermoanaerobaculia bacterium]
MGQSSRLIGLALDAFMPALSPVVALAFLGTGFLLVGAAVGAGIAAVARRTRLARGLAAFGLAVAVVYATVLVATALVSRDRTLAPGERKYFCEMDCHLAYEVTGAEAPDATTRVVTVRTWFDPSTIAPFRGDGPYAPGRRHVFLVDGAGRRYAAAEAATEAWRAAHGGSTPLDRELRPGESYSTTFVFEAPADAGAVRLFVGDADGGVERLLIGHENSPWHGKVYFALPGARKVTG